MEIDEFKKLKLVGSIGKYKVKQKTEKEKTKKKRARKGRMVVLSKGKYIMCAWVSYRGNVKGMWQFDCPDTVKVQAVDSKCVVCSIK